MNQATILLIEDDPAWQLVIQQMLNQLGLNSIRIAFTLAQARKALEEQRPDLVITDMVLPDGLSVELFTDTFRDLPVIFQTAYSREDYLKRAITLPYIGFLVKPYESFGLRVAIELLFSQQQLSFFSHKESLMVTDKHRRPIALSLSDIYWIKAEGNYTIINTLAKKYVLKRSLRLLAQDLAHQFIQVHKAYLVNQQYIKEFTQSSVEVNQQQIPIGRSYRKQFLASLV